MQIEEFKKAHEHSINNEIEILASGICGCFYCLKIFEANKIVSWLEDKQKTAKCPYCNVDAVIGDVSGFKITNKFLKYMHNKCFN